MKFLKINQCIFTLVKKSIFTKFFFVAWIENFTCELKKYKNELANKIFNLSNKKIVSIDFLSKVKMH